MNPIKDLYHSFFADRAGFSARKLGAFAATMAAIIISINHSTPENAFMLACANYTFALLCLGLVNATQILEWRTGRTTTEKIEIKKETNETTAP